MSSSNHVRWNCRAVRLRCALAGDRPPRWADRHLAACAECRQYFAEMTTWEHALHADAQRGAVAAPSDFEARLLRTLHDESATGNDPKRVGHRAPKHRRSPWLIPALVVPAGAAALALLFLGPHTAPSGGASKLGPRGTPAPLANAVEQPLAARDAETPPPTPTVTELVAPVTSALSRDPLQVEAESVYADARSAVQFLALNFLPTATVAQNGRNNRHDVQMRTNGG